MWSTLRWTRSLVTLAVAAVSLGTLATIPAAQQGQVVTTPSGQQLRVEPVATNLDTIWDMVWAPDGDESRGRWGHRNPQGLVFHPDTGAL